MDNYKYTEEDITSTVNDDFAEESTDRVYLTPLVSMVATSGYSFYNETDRMLKKIESERNFKNFIKKKKRREFWK